MEIEMDSAQFHHHHQEMSSQTLESMLVCNKAAQEKKPRPPDEAALKCPRCDSTNTKFCYYNNYSLIQPRYFCKSCRRYWTKGGTLRNVPVGGGCRKSNKRPSSSSSTSTSPTSSSSSKRAPISSHDLIHHQPFSSNHILTHLPTNYHHDSSITNTATTDLSLAFARLQSQANVAFNNHDRFLGGNSQNAPSHDHFLSGGGHHGFLDALRGGFLENGGNNSSNGLFHNLYSSYGDQSQMGNVENGGILGLNNVSTNDQDHHQLGMNQLYHNEDHHQMDSSGAATTAVTVTTVKQELPCNGREVGGGERSESSRVLWGFPWQIGGSDHQGNVIHHEVDSGRSQIGGNNWNGFGSNWHGLLNSPLM